MSRFEPYLNRVERNAIYDTLIKKFSPNAQMIVAIEELSELQKEICKYLRNKEQLYLVKGLIEEIADVEIMLEQIKFLLSLDWQVEGMKDQKIRRTQERYLKEVSNER